MGIRDRLRLAFIAVASFAVLAAIAGWIGFDAVKRANDQVVNQALPTLTTAARIGEISKGIVLSLPSIGDAENLKELNSVAARLETEQKTLAERVDQLNVQGIAAELPAKLSETATELFGTISRQEELVQERLNISRDFRRNLATSLDVSGQIVELSRTLVENASTQSMAALVGVYDLIEDRTNQDEAFRALDVIVEENLDQLERMTELRVLAGQLNQHLNELSRETRPVEIAKLQKRYRNAWTIVETRLQFADDPSRKDAIRGPLEDLRPHTIPGHEENLFDARIKVVSLDLQTAQLTEQGTENGQKLIEHVVAIQVSSNNLIDGAIAASERTYSHSRTAMFVIAAVSLIVSGLILFFYVQGNLLDRLSRLHGGMAKLAEGRLDTTIEDTGTDELRSMAGTLEVFRQTALARSQLEEETREANQKLKRYQNELEQLVEERTQQLTNANKRLADEAEQLEKARDSAQAADRAKSVFLATMSHEIRTPMNGVLGTTSLLRATKLTEEQELYARTISESGHLLLRILNDILDYSKIEAGRLQFEKVDFSVYALIQRLINLYTPEAERKGLLLGCEIEPDLPESLSGDPTRLQQVLANLIDNAIKFTDEGEVYIVVTGEPVSMSRSWRLRFDVSDSGIGIADEKLGSLFDAFSQATDSTSRKYGGTGLGLAICDRIVRGMGGAIGVDSTPGSGSTFWFDVELGEGTSRAVSDEATDLRPLAPMTVLLAEDTEVNRFVARKMLENMGHRVIEAVNGAETVDLAHEHKPDVILMDISMPVMDGREATKTLRSNPDDTISSIPIIAVTAHVVADEVESMLKTGINGLISKPFDSTDLVQAMRAVLDGQTTSLDRKAAPVEQAFDSRVLEADRNELGAETVSALIRTFLEEGPRLVSAIEVADEKSRRAKAHALKGAAASVGLVTLSRVADEIENGERRSALRETLEAGLRCLRAYEESTLSANT